MQEHGSIFDGLLCLSSGSFDSLLGPAGSSFRVVAGGGLGAEAPAERLRPRAAGAPRVVLVLFDELDLRAAFGARPARSALPQLDLLHAEAFAAKNAFAPARETRRSVASMLLGKQVTRAMTEAGLWDRTTVIVTSDHWWRAIHREDWGLTPEEAAVFANERNRRVPFLVELAQRHGPLAFPRVFKTLLVHDLVVELVAGRIASPRALASWLDEHRRASPVPYPAP